MSFGGLIGAGISGLGSWLGADAAAKAQKDATKAQLDMYNQTRSDLGGYRDAGTNALNYYQNAMGLNGQGAQQGAWNSIYTNNPAFEGAVSNANRDLQNSAFARGMGMSGNLANQLYLNSAGMRYNAGQTTLGQIFGLAGLGENAAAQTGNAATATGQQIGQSIGNAGLAQGIGIQGAANSFGNALTQYGKSYPTAQSGVNAGNLSAPRGEPSPYAYNY
jgi:hypothetical protein